jgi:hypothetical protein
LLSRLQHTPYHQPASSYAAADLPAVPPWIFAE